MDLFSGVMYAIRLGQLNRFSQEREWEFYHILRDYSLEQRYPRFSCLRQGKDRFAYNIMSGQYEGYAFTAFDYHYHVESRRKRPRHSSQPGFSVDLGNGFRFSVGDPPEVKHHEFSGVILETDLPLRSLTIRPSNAFMRGVSDFIGTSGVQFELMEFNDQFHVDAPDASWAFDVLPQKTLEFLLRCPRFSLQMEDGHVMVYRDSLFSPEEFISALDLMVGILQRLPDYFLRELQER